MWPFTGGCHYPDVLCTRYEQGCGACPLLSSKDAHDPSSRFWKMRQSFLGRRNLTFVSPSRWLADCAGKSALLHGHRIVVIPNGIDTNLFRPMEKLAARRLLGLPLDKKVVLFGAVNAVQDPRKGFPLLVQALDTLRSSFGPGKVLPVLFGSSQVPEGMGQHLQIRCMGTIGDDRRLSALYSSADLFLVPSVQDNLPNTVMEAMASGTPCVANSSGGIPDMVVHDRTGALCPANNPEAFAGEIARLLRNAAFTAALGEEARRMAVTEYSLETISRRYLDLYETIRS
jgi:glycosyltransferase involved in cell wall biosynthesis